MGRIFVTSDYHFCHDREFIYGSRGFSNVEEMNDAIVRNHNQIVDWDDDVYILGDCILNNNDKGIYLLKQLNGRLHIICGNHETSTRRALYENCHNVVEVADGKRLDYGGFHFFLSHWPCLCANHNLNKPLKNRLVSLAGHIHTDDCFLDWDKLVFHCEIDTNGCYPWLIDDIITKIKEKENKK